MISKINYTNEGEIGPLGKKDLMLLNKEHFLCTWMYFKEKKNVSTWKIPETSSPKMTSSQFSLFI